jgi:hypothetical protein
LSAARKFGALVAHESVTLVEYRDEPIGMRVIDQWVDHTRSASIGDALDRLAALLAARAAERATLAVAIEQFGVFHHVMTLPGAPDEVLRTIVQRESQRLFGVPNPVVAFVRGDAEERRAPNRADDRTAPRQLFIAGAPRETIAAFQSRLDRPELTIEIVTVVPKAVQSLYEGAGATLEPTAVLVCLDGGPHLSYFIDHHLELALDPPIALEGERPSVAAIVDQVERGAVYFRQEFRGAEATRVLLAAPANEYDALAAALQQQLGVRVNPLFDGTAAPEAVVAMGAVVEARRSAPLDLFPHPPTTADRARAALRGPNALVAGAAAVAVIAALWSGSRFAELTATHRHASALQDSVRRAMPLVEPMRAVAQRRADFANQISFVRGTYEERTRLAATLTSIASSMPASIRIDSLHMTRVANGWSGAIGGEVSGQTGALAVRGLDDFYRAARAARGVGSVTLDRFDYPTASAEVVKDSTHRERGDAAVIVEFRLLLTLASGAGPAPDAPPASPAGSPGARR